MADKVSKPLAGFDIFDGLIIPKKDQDMNKSGNEEKGDFQDIDPEELEKQLLGQEDDEKKLVEKKVDDKKVNVKDDKKVDTKEKDTKKVDEDIDEEIDTTKSTEDKEYESDISTFFGSELAKKLKLDVDEKDLKFESVDEVLELMSEIVNENSKPTYASDEVEAYDEFVRNGGSLKDFYKEVYSGKLDATSIDLEKEYDQRAVIRENLLNQGYKEDKIKKMIGRYEESETLKEEAEDALDLVKEFNQKKADTLLVQQRNEAVAAKKQQQKFYDDVNSTIKSISSIKGFPISEKGKRELLQYAFAPEEDGMSKYQKEYRANVMNILESAWLAMNKDKNLVIAAADDANKKGNTDAYKTLRDKLKAKGSKQVDDDQKSSKKLGSGSLGDFGKGIIF
jgi:hypothetical protein